MVVLVHFLHTLFNYTYNRMDFALSIIIITRDGSSRRAAGLQPSLKNVRQKIPPNGQTRHFCLLAESYETINHYHYPKFGFSYENFTTQSFSVLLTPFGLNVSQE